MAEEYEKEVLAALRMNPHRAETWSDWGRGLLRKADASPVAEKPAAYAEAGSKFTVATNLAPGEAAHWFNLAVAIQGQAIFGAKSDLHERLVAATDHFEKAVRCAESWDVGWKAWGEILCRRADNTTDPAAAVELLRQAEIRYAVSDELNPNNSDTLRVWGVAIGMQAGRAGEENAPALWHASGLKFAEILRADPKYAPAWSTWALFLSKEAKSCKDRERSIALYDNALRKLEIALEWEPNNPDHWRSCGEVLTGKAGHFKGSEKQAFFAEASKKFERASLLAPDSGYQWAVWAQSLCEQGSQASEADYLHLYQESGLRYSIAMEIEPDQAYIPLNWAVALSRLALVCPDDEALPLLEKSLALSRRAEELDPNSGLMYSNWGYTLTMRARIAPEPARSDLLRDAVARCERAAQFDDPAVATTWNNWGYALLALAERKAAGDEREVLLKTAEEKLDRVDSLTEDGTEYNRAVLAALRGDADTCRSWLERCEETDNLETRSIVRGEAAFTFLRDEEWFCQLLGRLTR